MTAPAGTPGRKFSAGMVAAILGVPGGVALLNPGLAVILYTVELAVLILAMVTAFLGPHDNGERAFRLLRWMTDRPEPPAPPTPEQQSAEGARLPDGPCPCLPQGRWRCSGSVPWSARGRE